jgi:hypothetical protein
VGLSSGILWTEMNVAPIARSPHERSIDIAVHSVS